MKGPFYWSPQEASAETGYTERQLQTLRLNGLLIEGVHWERHGHRTIKFIRESLMDWVNSSKAKPPSVGSA